MKNRTEEVVGKLKLSEVPEKLWTHLTVDFITKLPIVARKDTILVVCNKLLKMTHFVATTEGTSVEEFIAELTKELNGMMGIEMRLLMAFHIQTDGQTK